MMAHSLLVLGCKKGRSLLGLAFILMFLLSCEPRFYYWLRSECEIVPSSDLSSQGMEGCSPSVGVVSHVLNGLSLTWLSQVLRLRLESYRALCDT